MVKLILKQGEAKTLTLTVRDGGGSAVDLTAATLFLGVKRSKSDADYAFFKDHAAFNRSRAAEGIVSVSLSTADTNLEETIYVGELKCSWAGPPTATAKSGDFFLQIKQAVTD
jgi:hypothetical protein